MTLFSKFPYILNYNVLYAVNNNEEYTFFPNLNELLNATISIVGLEGVFMRQKRVDSYCALQVRS